MWKIVALVFLFILSVNASYFIKIKVSGHSDTVTECAGAVIHRNFVLTAASCIEDKENTEPEKVSVEGLLPNALPFTVYGNAVFLYPCHDGGCGDLALIRLTKPVESAVVAQYASYPASDLLASVGTDAEVFGTWKAWPNDSARVKISDCRDLNANISECAICATAPQVCESGSVNIGVPLVLKVAAKCSTDCSKHVSIPVVVGVSSKGNGCGGSHGLYTRVSRYSDWIRDIVNPGDRAYPVES